MKEVRDILRFWEARQGEPFALATLVATRGSSFRRPGARMLIHKDGTHVGGLSAGCIEEEVVDCAGEVLRTGHPRLMTFDTRLRFGCHGAIDIFVEPAREAVMTQWRECFDNRQACRLETITLGEHAGTRIAGFVCIDGAYLQTLEPPLRLVLVGDGAEMLAMRGQAGLLGWEIMQIEVEEISAEVFDDRTAVLLATHNYGRDCAALRKLLPLGLNYLGVVGSRRRRDNLLFDALQQALTLESSLFAPAGLHLGADSPEEIALSIIAEIQCVFAAGTAQHLRETNFPIHHCSPTAPPCQSSPV